MSAVTIASFSERHNLHILPIPLNYLKYLHDLYMFDDVSTCTLYMSCTVMFMSMTFSSLGPLKYDGNGKAKQTNKQTGRQTDRQTDRQTGVL